jgi:hypothetical protein
MFNRHSLFDKTNFDREVISDGLKKFRLFSGGSIDVVPEIYTPIIEELGGEGGFNIVPLFESPLSAELASEGSIEVPNFTLVFEMEIRLGGGSDIVLFPIGSLDISVLDLQNISLGPSQSVTIDTDLMVVLFGTTHDVSSLTLDSEFFQLGVGTNQLIFIWEYEDNLPPDPLPDDELEATIIWENRYL